MFDPEFKSSKRQTLLRWLKSAKQRNIEMRSFPLFWQVRKQRESIFFKFRRFLFKLKTSFDDGKEWKSSHFTLFRIFFFPFVGALFFTSIIEVSSSYAGAVATLLTKHFPAWTTAPLRFYQNFITIDAETYTATFRTLLGPLITVSGAFLGLYFTAFNSLIGSTYRQVSRDVRTLLIRDKVGSAYTRVVAFTGAYALVLFGTITAGYVPSLSSLCLLVCLGIAEIYCFLFQWIRLFQLFDPSNLVFYLRRDLSLLIQQAAITERWSKDPSFQSHFQKNAERLLGTYKNLLFSVRSEEHLRSHSLIKLATEIITLVFFYEYRKHLIPTESFWFRRTYLHKEWITAADHETSLAFQTGTSLRPTEMPEHLWLEKEVGRLIGFTLEQFLAKKDLQNALSLSQNFQNITKRVARGYGIDESFALFQIMKRQVNVYVEEFETPSLLDDDGVESVLFSTALVDFNALSFIDILLGFAESTETLDRANFEEILEQIDWSREESIYCTKLPREVIKQLEYCRGRILFEKTVEGQTITPKWYLLQLIVLAYFRFIQSAMSTLLAELDDLFVKGTQATMKRNQHIIAAELISRGFEACNKLEHHFHSLEVRIVDLEKTQILTDIPRKEFDWPSTYEKITKTRETLVVYFSKALIEVIKIPRNQRLPDYFGHAYVTLVNECYWALVNKKEELFIRLFGPVFIACFEAFERQKNAEITDNETKFILMADPIIDLVELSGYAKIFEDLDERSYWAKVKDVWDKYNEGIGNRLERAKFLVSVTDFHSFRASPRSLDRTRWEMVLRDKLQECGILDDDFMGGYYPRYDEPPPPHASPIINSMTHSVMLNNKARDVFIALYFADEIEAKNLTVPDSAARLYKELNRKGEDQN